MKLILFLAIAVLAGVSLLPVRHAETTTFANPMFQHVWNSQSTGSGDLDLWGSQPLPWREESYVEAPGGRRLVQYFDRGRMELMGGPEASSTVTQGLLAQEMTTGRIRLGNVLAENRMPAEIPVDGGPADQRVPTYSALSQVVGRRASVRSDGNALVQEWIDARGTVVTDEAVRPVRLVDYVPQTGHHLPDATVQFFNRRPFGNTHWVEALGYPISEPYWAFYRRGGVALPSIVQVFERRILVYTPELSPGKQFTLPNVGQHYYRWRYDSDPSTEPPATPTQAEAVEGPVPSASVSR